MANYLLRNHPIWNPEKVDKILSIDDQSGIRINPTVPVYIANFTSWVDINGQINFRNDLYNLGKKLSKEVFGASVKCVNYITFFNNYINLFKLALSLT